MEPSQYVEVASHASNLVWALMVPASCEDPASRSPLFLFDRLGSKISCLSLFGSPVNAVTYGAAFYSVLPPSLFKLRSTKTHTLFTSVVGQARSSSYARPV